MPSVLQFQRHQGLRVLVAAGMACWFGDPAASAQSLEAAAPGPVQRTLRTYCWDCHDRTTAKARFSLEDTPTQFADPAVHNRWIHVYDRMSRGEMPPSDKPQPPSQERAAVLSWLEDQLRRTSRERQMREGRAPLRRLSRAEYMNATADLLFVQVELESVLPEDTLVAGFDKVSRSLDLSAQHWLRYQEAAERVVEAMVPSRPPKRQHQRFTGREWFRQQRRLGGPLAELVLSRAVRVEGESVTLYAQSTFHPHLQLVAGTPASPGRYRLRASMRARANGGRPLPVLFSLTGYLPDEDPTLKRVLAIRDVPESRPGVLEVDLEVPHDSERWKARSVALAGWSLPLQRQPSALEAEVALNTPADFSGPGLTIDWVEFEGPLDEFPSAGYRALFDDLPLTSIWLEKQHARGRSPGQGELEARSESDWASDPLHPLASDPLADGRRLLERFVRSTFPRPLPADVLSSYQAYVRSRLEKGEDFGTVMKAAYQAMLSSPHWLFRLEKPGRLSGSELAVRLAGFLWNSLPDRSLRERAASGQLDKPALLRAEVERMLDDPRSARLTDDLANQWLELRNLDATTPDLMYGEFDDALRWSMAQETYAFLRILLQENRPIDELVQSDWSCLNERLARHYGIPGVGGGEVHRTPLPAASHRGGVITHASVLKVTANGTTTSPVLRGKWILDKILGQPPSPPPPDTPVIEPDIRGSSTIREQLEKHRQVASCARCHRWIDPPGFALETFDVIGGWREWYRSKSDLKGPAAVPNYPHLKVWRGPTVEQGYVTGTGKPFANIDQYRTLLLEDRDQIARNLIQKLVLYATGAEIQFADREVVEDLLQNLRAKGYGFRDLVHAVIQSRLFLEK